MKEVSIAVVARTIGVLGGMGPYATIDLCKKIILSTPAQSDQEHIPMIIYNNPRIPPRVLPSASLDNSPLPELARSARLLERAGADFIIMPCHTAHLWLDRMRAAIAIPLLSMVETTVQAMLEQQLYMHRKILLLATETTVQGNMYQAALADCPFAVVIPAPEEQRIVDQAIRQMKASHTLVPDVHDALYSMLLRYEQQGVAALLECCTEIPLIIPRFELRLGTIDPTLLLAQKAVSLATGG